MSTSTTNKTFKIKSMCCPGCATNVMNTVFDLEGVQEVDANHGDNEVHVMFDNSVVSEDVVLETAEKAGCGMS